MFIHYTDSPLGKICMASDGESITGLWVEGQKYYARTLSEQDMQNTGKRLEIFRESEEWLSVYFQGKEPGFMPCLSLKGTLFQMEVWELLLQIPYGENVTYGELAGKVAALRGISSMSAQAVGGAVGRNPISILVPCHRVIGADGSLTGYAGGTEKKRYLLQLEGSQIFRDEV